MATIRVLEREDLPGVSRLLRAHLPGAPADEAVLAATLLDESSSDLGVSSLVAEDAEGAVVGFIAAEMRPLRLDSDRIRAVCCSNLVVAPESRAGATGALMLKRVMAGPQELTFSETAMALVARIWTALGGHLDHARAYDWMLVLRPVRWLAGAVPLAARGAPEFRQRIPVPVFPAQALGPRLAKRAFPALEDDVRGEDADASLLTEHMPALSQGMRLHPDYDEPYLTGLLKRLDTEGDDIVHRLVRRSGRPIGWYAYCRRPGGTSVVLHISGPSRDLDAVVGELVAHAQAQGSVALTGRMEPHLHDPLRRRGAPLWYARGAVVHTRDPTIAAVLATEQSLLTRLEGEWHLA
jgi:hypothetical protein